MRYKNYIIVLLLFVVACSTEQTAQIDEEHREFIKQMNQHYLAQPLEVDDDNYIFSDRGKVERNMVMNEYFEDDAIDLSKWQEMDQRIRDGFDELRSENPDANWYYDMVLNAYSMLHKYLNRVELTSESARASEYYLDLLMENEAPDLNVLAPTLARLRHHLDEGKFESYRAQVVLIAEHDIPTYQKRLEKMNDNVLHDPFLSKARDRRYCERRLRVAQQALEYLE